jgi:flotillin
MPEIPSVAYIALAAVCLLVLLMIIWKACWKNPEPNEALVISGLRSVDEAGANVYRVVVGHGALVVPFVSQVRRLGLQVMRANLTVKCVTAQGVAVTVLGVVLFRVGDTASDITNAAKRFMDQQETKMVDLTVQTFDGHLRSIVGGMTVEELLNNRQALTTNVRDAAGLEMQKLGLSIDSLQISDIEDPSGYIFSISAPHVAAAKSAARIAQAQRDQEASIAEAAAQAQIAEAKRDSEIKQAAAQAQVDKANAEMAQAGPLAEATAKQQVTEAETRAAQLQAQLEEQRLQTTVRKPADAQAYATETKATADRAARISAAQAQAEERRLLGEATAQAARMTGEAEAAAREATGKAEATVIQAKGAAEAASIKARAEALATGQDAVIAQQIAENLPQIVAAAAEPLSRIQNLTVLDGASGVTGIIGEVLGQVATILPAARGMFTTPGASNGSASQADSPELATAASDNGRVDA